MRRVMILLMCCWCSLERARRSNRAPVRSRAAAGRPRRLLRRPSAAPAPPPQRVEESVPVPAISEDAIGNRSLEDLNRNSPLQARVLRTRQLGARRRWPRGRGGQRRDPEEVSDVGGHHRGTLRRARHRGVQPGARRTPRGRGQDVSRGARHRARSAAHGELRQGVPVRYRAIPKARGRRTAARIS